MKTRAVAQERTAAGVTVTLDTGQVVRAPLLVAAEGRRSPTREAAGIAVARWQYDHAAIVGAFHHERPHRNIAFEIFYPTGPFALLPLIDDDLGHRSAIVWTVAARDAAGMLKLGDRGFLAEATPRTASIRSRVRASTSASATWPRWPRCWWRASAPGSIWATLRCLPGTSGGAGSTPLPSPPPPTR
jgi:2-octaprenyl-6-methoxyphenol hydroxylase